MKPKSNYYAQQIKKAIEKGDLSLSDFKLTLHISSTRQTSRSNYQLTKKIEYYLNNPNVQM